MDIRDNFKQFHERIRPDDRDASFDYCFNYFQNFRAARETTELANPPNLQISCLHLGFYLASWGMYRGGTTLLQKSARYLAPIIELLAGTDTALWEIDVHLYSDSSINDLFELVEEIRRAYPAMSDTLLTKILLGVFGSVPAFDTVVRCAFKAAGIEQTFNRKALLQLRDFYQSNAEEIDACRAVTLDFDTAESTHRRYTRAKVIDMVFFIEGEKLL